uniref:uncharacterized protein n=1 Tax=Myxine glutinosa TaxID=7769 RepID=UPI00358EC962
MVVDDMIAVQRLQICLFAVSTVWRPCGSESVYAREGEDAILPCVFPGLLTEVKWKFKKNNSNILYYTGNGSQANTSQMRGRFHGNLQLGDASMLLPAVQKKDVGIYIGYIVRPQIITSCEVTLFIDYNNTGPTAHIEVNEDQTKNSTETFISSHNNGSSSLDDGGLPLWAMYCLYSGAILLLLVIIMASILLYQRNRLRRQRRFKEVSKDNICYINMQQRFGEVIHMQPSTIYTHAIAHRMV